MARMVFHGGRVFDGTGAALADADVVIEDGRIVEVGPGLDGDEGVDCAGKAVLPGLFDCHVHLAMRYEDFDEYARMQEPFSLPFFRMHREPPDRRSRSGSPRFATPREPMPGCGPRSKREPSSVRACRSR